MLAIKNIILVVKLLCFVGKLIKRFHVSTLEKPDFDSMCFFKFKNAWKTEDNRATRINARAIIDSVIECFTEEPIHEFFAQNC